MAPIDETLTPGAHRQLAAPERESLEIERAERSEGTDTRVAHERRLGKIPFGAGAPARRGRRARRKANRSRAEHDLRRVGHRRALGESGTDARRAERDDRGARN